MNKSPFVALLLMLSLPFSVIAQKEVGAYPDNVPINFSGRVVDDVGLPLEGAEVVIEFVAGEARIMPGFPNLPVAGTRTDQVILQTDKDGTFTIKNRYGHGFQIKAINKEGYRLSQKIVRSYAYTQTTLPFHEDPNKPVVFKMWRLRGKQPLIQSSWDHKVFCDGRTNCFEMLTGRENTNGSLEIMCQRSPVDRIPREGKKFDYEFEVSVKGGNIQPTDDEFTYLAPETGYSPAFVETKKAGEAGWRGRLTQEFYFRTSEGNYGTLTINWFASQANPTHLDWNCCINPSGSRNLER